jgi:hypothetical protein
MTDKIKTYVITSPDHTNLSWSLGPTGLTGYDGFFYSIAGAGGVGGTLAPSPAEYAGSGGYIQSGYVDLSYPYNVDNIQVSVSNNSSTTLSIYYTGPNIDPTNGQHPFVLTSDAGYLYTFKSNVALFNKFVCGFYAPGNQFTYSTGNPILVNQRNIDSGSNNNTPGNGGPIGALTDILGQESSTVRAGGGFYAGGTGIFGATGPFGFSAGGYNMEPVSSTGYAIISLVPSSMAITSSFLNVAGDTGTYTGNTGLYLYSLLGGGGGGAGDTSSGGNDSGGGGSGNYRCGIFDSISGSFDYEVGSIGLGGYSTSQPSNGGDTTIESLVAIGGKGGTNLQVPGDGYFTGGVINAIWYANSYINMPSYNSTSGSGAGCVPGYGQSNAGGGGGGPYGGNGNGTVGGCTGYGNGGGGGSPNGGDGTGGYIILKNISSPNIKFYKITSNTTFDFLSLFPYTGFWFFLDGDSGINSFDMGHFLIKEDNVRQILIQTSGGYFYIKVDFGTLYNQPQQYSLRSSEATSYMNILFYS